MGGQRSPVGCEDKQTWRKWQWRAWRACTDGERGIKREGTGDDRLAPREGFFPGGAELVGPARAWGR